MDDFEEKIKRKLEEMRADILSKIKFRQIFLKKKGQI